MTPFFLNGQTKTSSSSTPLRAPFNQSVLADVAQATPADIESAIQGMLRAAEPLRRLPSYKRAEACAHIHKRLIERTEDFARTIALEAGKPIRTARNEVARGISTFKIAAEEATRIAGEQLPVDIDARGAGYWAVIERFPVGPSSFITPFNFPLNLVAHKVAPALAAGCPFIIKPSERTPLTALLLGELLAETGLPEGAFSVLPCDRATAGPLVSDERIKLLSFTGSPDVGFKMKSAAGKKHVVLELGSNSGVILEPGTNLADAVPRIVSGAFGYAGQSCISVQRIFLHESLAAEATRLLVEAAAKLIVGNPLDKKTDVGPVIDAAAADRIQQWINASGGTVLCGNRRLGPTLLAPTLVQNPNPQSDLVCQEAFGPVATVETYSDFEEALARINASRFGLQTGLFCNDIQKIRHAFQTLEVGGLIVNDVPTTRIDNMPYGGLKDSGLGREGVKYAIEHMTERKVLVVRQGFGK